MAWILVDGTNSWLEFLLMVGGGGPVRPGGAEEEAVVLFEMATQVVVHPLNLLFTHFLELNSYSRFHTSIVYSMHVFFAPVLVRALGVKLLLMVGGGTNSWLKWYELVA